MEREVVFDHLSDRLSMSFGRIKEKDLLRG
jgi:hypothetical protein